MKTQLLEDIGESTELPATPSVANARPMAKASGHGLAAAGAGAVGVEPVKLIKPLKPRSAPGVWRTRPVVTLPVATFHEQEDALPQEPPAPAALEHVFEEIAALEAQLAQPKAQAAPEDQPAAPEAQPAQPKVQVTPEGERAAPDAPDPQVAVGPAALPPALFSLAEDDRTTPNSMEQPAAPHGPLFYFDEPPPATAEASVPAPAAVPPARRGGKYVLGTACLLSVALLAMGAMGARSLYQGRGDATLSASVGAQTKASAPAPVRAAADKPAAPTAATLPDVPAPGEPYVFEDRRAPDLPPLVMLEPEPPAPVVAAVPAPSPVAERATPVVAKPAPARTVIIENKVPKLIASKPIPPKPVVAKTTAAKLTVAKPVAARPIAARPIVVKPVTAKQTAPKLIVPRTLASRPSAAKPAAAKPAAPKEIVRKAAQAARQAAVAPTPAASIRKERALSRPVSQSERDLPEPAPLRPFAQVVPAPRPTEQDTSMEATLRACREHGYHEMQCIRRECSMTAYGFACRGR